MSFLNWLLNFPNPIQKRFFNEFLYLLNQKILHRKEQLNIETLQFVNAEIFNISQINLDKIVIHAVLDIVHLIFNIVNTVKYQHYSIEIPKLTGELQIFVTNCTNQYSIEVKFQQIKIDNAEIIDPKNVLSTDEKQAIIKLLKETIRKSIVSCCCHLSDSQETIANELQPQRSLIPTRPELLNINQECETPILALASNDSEPKSPATEVKRLLVRIVKAVKLYDVEQPFCIIELNQPKQTHQTSIAKNGVNPFWDECFAFDCNKKSNQIRLKIIDRKRANKKQNANIIETTYADVSIPFSYATSQSYKQDVRITPQHPDSIIRIEFSTLSDEETLAANKNQSGYSSSPSDEIVTLPYNGNLSPKDNSYTNDNNNISSTIPRQARNNSAIDAVSTTTTLLTYTDDRQRNKPRKSRSFMNSFRQAVFHRRKKNKNDEQIDQDGISSLNATINADVIPHSLSAEPCVSTSPTNTSNFRRNHSITRSFRNMFRSKANKNALDTSNVIVNHEDSVSTSTPTPQKRSFFRRFKLRKKRQTNGSTNSLNSNDCTRSASARNTPVRANGGRPVTMTNTIIR